MAIECRFLDQGGPYERTATGWVDTARARCSQLNARLSDGLIDLEVSLLAEPSPSYHVSRATATARSEPTKAACGPLLDAFGGVTGLRIVAGFRRQVAGLLGEHPFAGHVLDAAIEAARLSRQVTLIGVPASDTLDPAEFHRLDLAAWPELLDLCFTYREESRALFAERNGAHAGGRRHVRVAARPEARVPPLQADARRPVRPDSLPLPVDVRPGARIRALVRRGRATVTRS